MTYVRGFIAFWYDFIVGDDWSVAVGGIIAFGATALLAAAGVPAWWLMPVAAASLLAASLWRATR